jgi:hypothetical protein
LKKEEAEVRLNDSIFEEATELLKDSPSRHPRTREGGFFTLPWLDDFRNSVRSIIKTVVIFFLYGLRHNEEREIRKHLHSF